MTTIATANELIEAFQMAESEKKARIESDYRIRENEFLEQFLEFRRTWLSPLYDTFAPDDATYNEDKDWQKASCLLTFEGEPGFLNFSRYLRADRLSANITFSFSNITHTLTLELEVDKNTKSEAVSVGAPAIEEWGAFLSELRKHLTEDHERKDSVRAARLRWARSVIAGSGDVESFDGHLREANAEFPDEDFSSEITKAQAKIDKNNQEIEARAIQEHGEREERKRIREERKNEARKVWTPFVIYELAYTDTNQSGAVDEERIHTMYVLRPHPDAERWWTSLWQGEIEKVRVFFPLKLTLLEVIHPTDHLARRICHSENSMAGIRVIPTPEGVETFETKGPIKFHFDSEKDDDDD